MKNEIIRILLNDVLQYKDLYIKENDIDTLVEFFTTDRPCAIVFGKKMKILYEYTTDISGDRISLGKGNYTDKFVVKPEVRLLNKIEECRTIDEISLNTSIPSKRLRGDEEILEFLPDRYKTVLESVAQDIRDVLQFLSNYGIVERFEHNHSILENLKVLREYNLG